MDLFGEDSEDEQIQHENADASVGEAKPSASSPAVPPEKGTDKPNENDETGKGLFGSDDESEAAGASADGDRMDYEEEDGERMERAKSPVEELAPTSIPNADLPTEQDLYSAKLPEYLRVEPQPFTEEDFATNLEDVEDDEELRIKLESTIRWRYENKSTKDGEVPRKESNARLVRWSDGSLSLLLGEEMFDVVLSKQEQEYQYLVATHVEEGLFQTQTRFKEHMTFRPTGLNSAVHKKLTASIAAKHKKEAKTQLTEVDIDPEKAKELAEKEEMEVRKARRKLSARRSNYNRGLTTGDLDDESDDDAYATGNRNIGKKLSREVVDEEDESDDSFVEDDDEEEDRKERERDERILKAKRGQDGDRSKGKSISSLAQELDASSDSDEGVQRRTKKRVQLSESDDD